MLDTAGQSSGNNILNTILHSRAIWTEFS